MTVCDGNLVTVCDAVPGTPDTELCGTGSDEDCDGETDEGFAGLGSACTAGQGSCEIAGVKVCGAAGLETECDAVPAPAGPETCNGLDDDCDGTIDNGGNACGGVCPLGGAPGDPCDGSDVDLCTDDLLFCSDPNTLACSAGATNAELCNGLDDDCDGGVDNGGLNRCGGSCQLEWAPGQPCDGPDADLCSGDDSYVCDGPNSMHCSDGPDDVEICNWSDDDCDGTSDEGACEVLDWARLLHADSGTSYMQIAPTADDGLLVAGVGHGPTLTVCVGRQDALTLPVDTGFVARLDAAGVPVWATAIPGEPRGVAELASGEIVVVGGFRGTATFVPRAAPVTAVGRFDGYLLRLDPAGSPLAAWTLGTSEDDILELVAALPGGGTAVAGSAGGAATIGAGGPNPLAVVGSFVAVLEPDDAPRWAENTPYVTALAASPDGALYTMSAIVTPNGMWGGLLVRRNAAGMTEWERLLEATRSAEAYALATAPDGGVALAGTFDGETTIESSPGFNGISLPGSSLPAPAAVRFTAAGVASWAVTTDPTDYAGSFGIAHVVGDGWLWTGQFFAQLTFDAGGPLETTLLPAGPDGGAFLVKLDDAGAIQWGKVPAFMQQLRVSVAPSGAAYLEGFLSGSVTVGLGESGEQRLVVPNDAVFLGRYVEAP